MSQLFTQIKQDQLAARKAKDQIQINLLTTLLGEILTSVDGDAIKVTDDICISIINKFVKNTNETIKLTGDTNTTAKLELHILNSYLPSKLSGLELIEVVASYTEQHKASGKTGGALVGAVMKDMKTNYPNQYDAKDVKALVEENNS